MRYVLTNAIWRELEGDSVRLCRGTDDWCVAGQCERISQLQRRPRCSDACSNDHYGTDNHVTRVENGTTTHDGTDPGHDECDEQKLGLPTG